jgi:hypothetical protein
MLNEAEKRKPNFSERNSAAVVLADGQEWWIPKPWLEIRPVFRGGKADGAYPAYGYGPDLNRMIERVAEAELFTDQVAAVATLAASLLCWQYDLSDPDLDQLLAYRRNDPDSVEWTRLVIEIATGRSGPKVSSAGGD